MSNAAYGGRRTSRRIAETNPIEGGASILTSKNGGGSNTEAMKLCSVCLGDYQAEEKLQQIPGCGHTFHRNCIDHWLATHTTCPLCRLSLVSPSKTPPTSEPDSQESQDQADINNDSTENVDDVLQQNRVQVLSVHTVV